MTISIDEARQKLDFEDYWVPYCARIAHSFSRTYSYKVDEEDLAAYLVLELFEKKDRLLADRTPDGGLITPAYTKKALANLAINHCERVLNDYFHHSDKYIYTAKVARGLLEQWMSTPHPAVADTAGSDALSLYAMFADCSESFSKLNSEQQGLLYNYYLNGKTADGSTDKRRFQAAIDRFVVLLNRNSRNDRRNYIGSRQVMTNREALERTRML